MTNAEHDETSNKFQRYRRSQQSKGLKLLRVWVQDPRDAAFRAEALRQAMNLRDAPEEVDAQRFIEASADWPER